MTCSDIDNVKRFGISKSSLIQRNYAIFYLYVLNAFLVTSDYAETCSQGIIQLVSTQYVMLDGSVILLISYIAHTIGCPKPSY